MRIHQLFEARRNPALNPKLSTFQLLEPYLSADYFIHFNSIEKVGIRPRGSNTYGPNGVYAFPADYFHGQPAEFDHIVKLNRPTLVHVLKLTVHSRVWDLSKLTAADINRFRSAVKTVLSTHINSNPSILQRINNSSGSLNDQWQRLVRLIIEHRRNERNPGWKFQLNTLFRELGWNAILDSTRSINDNPYQIIFLDPKSFDVVKTFPIRSAA